MHNCPFCGSQHLVEKHEQTQVSHKGLPINCQTAYTACEICFEEFVLPAQSACNDKSVREAKKLSDGLMSAEEIRASREHLGLTQQQAAVIFGGGANSFSKYERSEVAQSEAMNYLIKLCSTYADVYQKFLSILPKEKLEKAKSECSSFPNGIQ